MATSTDKNDHPYKDVFADGVSLADGNEKMGLLAAKFVDHMLHTLYYTHIIIDDE